MMAPPSRASPPSRSSNFFCSFKSATALTLLLLLGLAAAAPPVDAASGYIGGYRPGRSRTGAGRMRTRSTRSRYSGGTGQRYGRGRRLLDDEGTFPAGAATPELPEPASTTAKNKTKPTTTTAATAATSATNGVPATGGVLRGSRESPDITVRNTTSGAAANAATNATAGAASDPGCLTLLETIETHPNLTLLKEAMSDLPIVRTALNARNETDTFFAPTDAAIESFTRWGGFNDTKAGLQELLGDVEWKGFIIAYHAVPDRYLTQNDLKALQGHDKYLEDALESEMPLMVTHEYNATTGENNTVIVGLGSTAEIVGSQILACNGVLHMIDKVLLPFDGDGELSPVQKARLVGAKKALDARYPDRVVIDHDNDDGAYNADDAAEAADAADAADEALDAADAAADAAGTDDVDAAEKEEEVDKFEDDQE